MINTGYQWRNMLIELTYFPYDGSVSLFVRVPEYPQFYIDTANLKTLSNALQRFSQKSAKQAQERINADYEILARAQSLGNLAVELGIAVDIAKMEKK